MATMTELYDQGGRAAIREHLRQLQQHDTPEEIADRVGFIRGWFAAQESYGVGVYAER